VLDSPGPPRQRAVLGVSCPSKCTWREIVEKDCQARKLNKEDAVDHKRWRKQIRDDR